MGILAPNMEALHMDPQTEHCDFLETVSNDFDYM
jgi:hypothetical protein